MPTIDDKLIMRALLVCHVPELDFVHWNDAIDELHDAIDGHHD